MPFHRKIPIFPVILSLALFLQPAAAAVRQVYRTSDYPSPMGRYDALTAARTFTMGIQAGAPTPGTPPTPNPANAAQSLLTVNGGLYARNFGATAISIKEGLTVGGTAWRMRSLEWFGENHFSGINIPLVSQPDAELHVNGDIDAYEIRASFGAFDDDGLLHFAISDAVNSGDGEDGLWVQMGSLHGTRGWIDDESVARFRGNPNIILNGYSHGNVGIGTKAPVYKLQVGEVGAGLAAITFSGGWKTFSSRAYKTDIRPLRNDNYRALSDKIGKLNVVRYRYKDDKPTDKKLIGVLAEEAPEEILSRDKRALALGETTAFLFAAIRGLKSENDALEREVAHLEQEIAARETRRGVAR